jgi:hypothetical protein
MKTEKTNENYKFELKIDERWPFSTQKIDFLVRYRHWFSYKIHIIRINYTTEQGKSLKRLTGQMFEVHCVSYSFRKLIKRNNLITKMNKNFTFLTKMTKFQKKNRYWAPLSRLKTTFHDWKWPTQNPLANKTLISTTTEIFSQNKLL